MLNSFIVNVCEKEKYLALHSDRHKNDAGLVGDTPYSLNYHAIEISGGVYTADSDFQGYIHVGHH